MVADAGLAFFLCLGLGEGDGEALFFRTGGDFLGVLRVDVAPITQCAVRVRMCVCVGGVGVLWLAVALRYCRAPSGTILYIHG